MCPKDGKRKMYKENATRKNVRKEEKKKRVFFVLDNFKFISSTLLP